MSQTTKVIKPHNLAGTTRSTTHAATWSARSRKRAELDTREARGTAEIVVFFVKKRLGTSAPKITMMSERQSEKITVPALSGKKILAIIR